jgi:hypothetical protein
MSKHRTEQVYDDEMAPLVARLIEIAKREKIPFYVLAGMLDEDGGPMGCTTSLVWGDEQPEVDLLGLEERVAKCAFIAHHGSVPETALA